MGALSSSSSLDDIYVTSSVLVACVGAVGIGREGPGSEARGFGPDGALAGGMRLWLDFI